VDPDTDPDPAFQVNHDQIRIQGFDDHKLKKKKIQMKNFFMERFVYSILKNGSEDRKIIHFFQGSIYWKIPRGGE
jgi:hypothetical protein